MPARLVALCKPNLLINEMAYLPFDRPAANFLLQLVSRLYERGAIILTSNKSYGDVGRGLQCLIKGWQRGQRQCALHGINITGARERVTRANLRAPALTR